MKVTFSEGEMPKTPGNQNYAAAMLMDVILTDGYTGDWKSALYQAFEIALRENIPVRVTYARQKSWLIYPTTPRKQIDEWAMERIVIGV